MNGTSSLFPLAESEILLRLKKADSAFKYWSLQKIKSRTLFLDQVAHQLEMHRKEMRDLISLEVKKTQKEADLEVTKSISTFEYYSKNAEIFLKTEEIQFFDQPFGKAWIQKEPLGVILAIMPWNFPLWQLIRFAVPALAAGNSILMKHSEWVPKCASLIEEIFSLSYSSFYSSNESLNDFTTDSSLREDEVSNNPPLLLQNFPLSHEQFARTVADPRIRAITFTGSTRGGQQVAEISARNLKKCVLELGGNDAYLIFPDADLDWAADRCAQSRLINQGQSCIAAKRILVHEEVYAPFKELFYKKMKSYYLPTPLINSTAEDRLENQILNLQKEGGFLVHNRNQGTPEVPKVNHPEFQIIEVSENMPSAIAEELFGPVALLFSFQSEVEALRIVNSSPYGLGGAVFSKDLSFAFKVASRMECGMVSINDFVRSDPRLPFGGIKKSGWGRELGSYGILEFVNIKTIVSC